MTQQQVTTKFGPGVIVASDTERGSTSYKVEGNGFSVWLTAAQIPEFGQMEWEDYRPDRVNYENSTTLPYNPQPQFYTNSDESTIQPNQRIDPEKRTSPADSVTFKPRDEVDRFPRNFASSRHTAGWEPSPDDPSDQVYTSGSFSADLVQSVGGQWKVVYYENGVRQTVDGKGFDTFSSESEAKSAAEQTIQEWEHGVSYPVASIHEATEAPASDANTEVDFFYPPTTIDEEYPGGTNTPADHGAPEYFSSLEEVQAHLSQKYIDIPVDVDWTSVQARLDDDPYRVVSDIKMENFENRQGLDSRIAGQMDLEASDPQVKQAAWQDVVKKASRLRRDGQVELVAANPTAIVANVTGDHGIYQVAVLRGSALTGSSSVSEWTCSCPWGDWAFERERTFVGRLCSHAYAALQELRSLTMRKNKPRDWSHSANREVEAATYTSPEDFANWYQSTSEIPDESVTDLGAATDEQIRELVEYHNREMVGNDPSESFDADEMIRHFKSSREAQQYPNLDGTLTTEPGTLTPDMEFVPPGDAAWQDDVEEGTPYPQPIVVDETREAFLSEPFAGSGPAPKDDWTSSEEYVELHERPHMQDINEDRGNPVQPNGDDARVAYVDDDDEEDYENEKKDTCDVCGEWVTESRPGVHTFHPDGTVYHNDGFGRQSAAETCEHEGCDNGPANGFRLYPTKGQQLCMEHSEDAYNRQSAAEHLASEPNIGLDADGTYDAEQIDVDDPDDIVAQFQKNAGYLLEGGSEPEGGSMDFAAAAAAFLETGEAPADPMVRTAGRSFTMAEQQALMDEEGIDGPIDQSGLDLRGTHYLS